jgi:6-phosphogluconolactonase
MRSLNLSPKLPIRFTLSLLAVTALWQLFASAQTASSSSSASGAAYVMTNRAEGNSVLVYHRAADGSLNKIQEALTGGLGTGVTQDPLMSQGAVFLSADGRLLFVVNPASGDLTAFVVTGGGLQFGSKISSGGALPVSVTASKNVVYVLNQLGIANIVGFTVDAAGHLQPLPNSRRELAGKALALPAQVEFTPDGNELLVTEKGTDQIDVFSVQSDGLTSGPMVQHSSGHTPFGFAFGPATSVVVTEAERRLPMQASASSYSVSGGGLAPVSSAVHDHQGAACWVTVTGGTAWVVNTLTSNISSYHVGAGGTITLANSVAASTGAETAPIDIASSHDGQFVYVLESAVGSVAAYRVNGSSLTPLFKKVGLPLSIQGFAVR